MSAAVTFTALIGYFVVGSFVARKVFWNFEQYVRDRWPTLYQHRTTIDGDDVPIAVMMCVAALLFWPAVCLYWGVTPFIVEVFKSPAAKAREAEKRQQAAIRNAYQAFLDSYKAGIEPDSPEWGLAEAQLIYARTLGDPPPDLRSYVDRAARAFAGDTA